MFPWELPKSSLFQHRFPAESDQQATLQTEHSDFDCMHPYFDGPTDAGLVQQPQLFSDSGAVAIKAKKTSRGNSVGSCDLLNAVANILRRSMSPIIFGKDQWRQKQKFLCSITGHSTNLLYPEAMVRPSVFPYSEQQALVGAMPSVLMSDKKKKQTFHFCWSCRAHENKNFRWIVAYDFG